MKILFINCGAVLLIAVLSCLGQNVTAGNTTPAVSSNATPTAPLSYAQTFQVMNVSFMTATSAPANYVVYTDGPATAAYDSDRQCVVLTFKTDEGGTLQVYVKAPVVK